MTPAKHKDAHDYAPVAVPICGDDGEHPLVESLVGVSAIADSVSPEPAQPYLEVIAPATLPEGYTFEAEANGHAFTVRVPVGGVEVGQKFSVPFLPGSNGYTGCAIPRSSVPVGHWKDGLCDCFRLGVIHPVVWNACFFPFLLLGQVMHRLKLTWLGGEGNYTDRSVTTFTVLAIIAAVHFCTSWVLYFTSIWFFILGALGDSEAELEESQNLANLRSLLNFSFAVLLVVIMARARCRIRSRYGIPERTCHGCEDCCCAFWCTCCTISQMARHTADYENYPATCCGETGLSPNAPSIV
ncbi:hypothetical protein ACHAXA_005844 [Cyclostephanos tholiformis]|uniref:Uncharacterized protein n=1 Tax=Cyclostephanos tholiformis TaxID=382380 RepID=A0ABD3RW83_9STRA